MWHCIYPATGSVSVLSFNCRTFISDNAVAVMFAELLFRYIHWTEQNYPKGGRDGNVVSLLKQCAKLFKDDERYKNDERYIKIWIKFVSIFHYMICLVKVG